MLNKGERMIFFINMGGGGCIWHTSHPPATGREREREERRRRRRRREKVRLISGYQIGVSNPYLLES